MEPFPDERIQDRPFDQLLDLIKQAVDDTIGLERVEVLPSDTLLGEVVWTGGAGWRFDRDERFDQEEPSGESPFQGQVGIGEITERTGTVEEPGRRPGDELVGQAIQGPDDVTPPQVIGDWNLVDNPTGNYTVMEWKAAGRPLYVRVRSPIGRSDEWSVRLTDGRIGGMGAALDPHTRTPASSRGYDNMAQATEAAIRWMATHGAATTDHPFWDARIANPPEGWEASNWSLNTRKESISFTTVDNAVAGSVPVSTLHIEGFHGGDTYKFTRQRQGLNHVDPDAVPSYPEPGENVPRDRILDAATQFMERHTPTIETALTDEGGDEPELDDDVRGRIKHHALRGNLAPILGDFGLRGPTVRRAIEAEVNDVEGFVEWYERHGDFEGIEGIGPARSDDLEAAARVIQEAFNAPVPDYQAGDLVETRAGNHFRIAAVEPEGTPQHRAPFVDLERPDSDESRRVPIRDFENDLRSGWELVDREDTPDETACFAIEQEIVRLLNADAPEIDEIVATIETAAAQGCIAEDDAERFANTLRGMEGARFERQQRKQLVSSVGDAFDRGPDTGNGPDPVDIAEQLEDAGFLDVNVSQPGEFATIDFRAPTPDHYAIRRRDVSSSIVEREDEVGLNYRAPAIDSRVGREAVASFVGAVEEVADVDVRLEPDVARSQTWDVHWRANELGSVGQAVDVAVALRDAFAAVLEDRRLLFENVGAWDLVDESPPSWRREGFHLNPPATVPRPEEVLADEFHTEVMVRQSQNRHHVDIRWSWDGESETSRHADVTVGDTFEKAVDQAIEMLEANDRFP